MAVAENHMTSKVIAVTPNDTLASARNVMLKRKIGRLLVVNESDQLVGILSRTDLAIALRPGGPAWRRRPLNDILVGDIMNVEIAFASPETYLSRIASDMLESGIGGMPILEYGRIVGIITTHDLTRYFTKEGEPSLKISDHLDRQTVISSPTHSVSHVIRLMVSSPSKRVIVLDDERLPIGIITPSSLAFVKFGGSRHGSALRGTRFIGITQAADIMSSPVFVAHGKDTVVNAAEIMVHNRIGGLPVLDEKSTILGIFTKREVLRIIAESMAK